MSFFLGEAMYVCRSILCFFFFCLTISYSARSQTATSQIPTAFQVQAQSAVSAGKPFTAVNLTANAVEAGTYVQTGVGTMYRAGSDYIVVNGGVITSYVKNADPSWGRPLTYAAAGGK
jgi:hypothetical protein